MVHALDESGMRVGETRSHGLSKPGQRITEHVPHKHWEVVTMLGTLSLSGISTMVTIDGAVDGELFALYVEQVLVPVLVSGAVVIMDNLGAHKRAEAIAAMERAGARVLFLPPYSPDFNPIEHAWSKIKAIVRGLKAKTRAELDAAIATAMKAIAASDAAGWFKHCGYAPEAAA
jgi:transposase